ncbi:hypothetical protein BDV10DRAFT_87017 [Aspergillus recurvatus]
MPLPLPLPLPIHQTHNKPRIFITLHPRGKNSLGENRTRLGFSAYHWGILISPRDAHSHLHSSSAAPASRGDHVHFDVTDSVYIDPATNENSDDWRFRERRSSDPVAEFMILGRVYVGKFHGQLSPAVSLSSASQRDFESGVVRLRERLSGISVPRKELEREDNCVSWTKEAIAVLRDIGVVEEKFDIDEFMRVALGFADECLHEIGENGTGGVLDYRTGKRLE